MRRIVRWSALLLFIALLLMGASVVALITGVAFKPFQGPLEEFLSRSINSQVSITRIRLNFRGDLLVSGVSVKYKELPRAFIPELVIDPRWSSLIRGTFVLDQASVDLGRVEFTTPNSKLSFDGQYNGGNGEVDANINASIASLRKEFGVVSGAMTAEGRIHGPWRTPRVTAKAHATAFQYKEVKITDAQLFWDGDINQGALRVQLKMDNGLVVQGHGPAQRTESGLVWRWKELRAKSAQGHGWTAADGGAVEISSTGAFDVQHLRILDKSGSIAVQKLSYRNESFVLEAIAEHFAGVVSGWVKLKGAVDRPAGRFEFLYSSATIQNFPPANIRASGSVSGGRIQFEHGVVENPTVPPILFYGSVPWTWALRQTSAEQMDISFAIEPLDPAEFFNGQANVETIPGGKLELSGHLTGPENAMRVDGTLSASLPVLKIPSSGVDARDVRLDLELLNQRLTIGTAEATFGKGKLYVTGESDLPELNYSVRGENVSLQARRRFDMKSDLFLTLTGSITAPFLSGEVHVDAGTYEVNKKKKDDDNEPVSSNVLKLWDKTRIEVSMQWDNNVWYRDGLTKIETQADLQLLKAHAARDLRVGGQMTLLRGSYDAYGRDFIIRTGDLTFTEETEIDARLNIQATHKMKDAVVDLDVTGTARKPELHFRSTPPMVEQDILAMLALGTVPGKSASSSSSSENSKTQATELAADVVSDYITRELRTTGMNVLDLDVIRVSPTDKGKEWTVGRYWGSKLFLSYSYNPDNTASQVLKAEYAVTPKWFLVGQSGSQADNYLDVNFRLPVGKSAKKRKKPVSTVKPAAHSEVDPPVTK